MHYEEMLLLRRRVLGRALEHPALHGERAVGIALALCSRGLVNADIRGRDVYRTLVFLSYPLMTVAVGIIWRWLYDERVGLINYTLQSLGLIDRPIAFLQSFDWGPAGRDRR
jgi:multiple sugar transport system permease protein